MIWRLRHPIRGLLAFVAVFAIGALSVGFGLGTLELLILMALSSGALIAAGRG